MGAWCCKECGLQGHGGTGGDCRADTGAWSGQASLVPQAWHRPPGRRLPGQRCPSASPARSPGMEAAASPAAPVPPPRWAVRSAGRSPSEAESPPGPSWALPGVDRPSPARPGQGPRLVHREGRASVCVSRTPRRTSRAPGLPHQPPGVGNRGALRGVFPGSALGGSCRLFRWRITNPQPIAENRNHACQPARNPRQARLASHPAAPGVEGECGGGQGEGECGEGEGPHPLTTAGGERGVPEPPHPHGSQFRAGPPGPETEAAGAFNDRLSGQHPLPRLPKTESPCASFFNLHVFFIFLTLFIVYIFY